MYQSQVPNGISMSLSGFYPSRNGETYALWVEVPVVSPAGKQSQVQHGNTKKKLISAFRVASDGSTSGFDTTNLVAKIGAPLTLITRAIVSVEKDGAIDTLPRAEFLAGAVTGSAATGTATLTPLDADALNYDFKDMTGAITLAYAPGKHATDLELYIMRATSPTQTAAGIDNLPLLPNNWQYTLWAIDSATKSLPPFNIYYGTFTSPLGTDSNPGDNHYPYPGGRYPADSTKPIYDLRLGGRVTVMITLEPSSGGARPAVPFGAIILQTAIPSTAQAFFPIELSNRSASIPSGTVTIYR